MLCYSQKKLLVELPLYFVKPEANLPTQRPTKVVIHFIETFNALLKEREKIGIIRQTRSTSHEKPSYRFIFLIPLINIGKNDCIKNVLDARHLKRNTDQSSNSWLLEPLAFPLARAKDEFKSAIDLMYAYAHAT